MKRILLAVLLLLACAPASSSQTLLPGYVKCAAEGALCKVPTPGSIIYGSAGAYLAPRPFVKDTWCNNATFGWVSMVFKTCWFKADAIPLAVVGSATLSWAAPTTNADGTPLTDLAGFRVYCGTAPGVYGLQVVIASASTLTATITPLASGTWYFVVRAVDTSGNESVASVEVSKVIP